MKLMLLRRMRVEINIVMLLTMITLTLMYWTTIIPMTNTYNKEQTTTQDIVVEDFDVINGSINVNEGITKLIQETDVKPIYQDTEESIDDTEVYNYDFELIGYIDVNTELNVRKEPNKESTIITTLNWMDKIEYSVVNDDWACVKLSDNDCGFIASKYIVDNEESYTKTYQVNGDKAKTYMDYRAITSRGSKQYRLQLRASTNSDNGLRILRDRYMVAVGSYFGCSIGQYIDVVLDDGEVLKCIVGDAKKDIHTDSQNLHGLSGDTIEFIVNATILKEQTDVVGNISDVSDTFDGKVVEIRKYDHIEH